MPPSQVFMNALSAGAAYSLIALGFNLILSSAKFLPLFLAVPYTLAAYTAFASASYANLPLWVALSAGVLAAALIGAVLDVAIFRRLRVRNAEPTVALLISLGLLAAFQSGMSLIFGDQTLVLRRVSTVPIYTLSGARVTSVQATSILVTVALFAVLSVAQFRSKAGRLNRAVASDPDLALATGVPLAAVYLGVFALGSAVVGIGGILAALDTDLVPTMGFTALFMGIVAAIVGGSASIPGALLGGLLVGLVQHLSVWRLPTQWQDAIVFTILILFLLLRPQGLLGRPLRRAAV